MLSLLLIISIYDGIIVNSSNFTYWRYGDGNFSNILPNGHTLFPTGSIADNATYQFTSSLNQIYFYPLISDKNEIFALTNNVTEYSSESLGFLAPLSLTKFDQDLSQISTLPLISDNLPIFQTRPPDASYSYPIYYRNEDNEYIIINVAHQTSYGTQESISHIFIINATSMEIIANITSNYFKWNGPGPFVNPSVPGYNPINLIIHNEYIVHQIIDQHYLRYVGMGFGNAYGQFIYNYPTNITAYDLFGNQLWNITYLNYYPLSQISMIAVHNKIIISQAYPTNITQYNHSGNSDNNYYNLTAIDIDTGNILLSYKLDINFIADIKWMQMIQPVAYPLQNLIIGGYVYQGYGIDPEDYFEIYKVEITDDRMQITMQRISIDPHSVNPHYYEVYLAINPLENSLLISNFTYIESSNCSIIEFSSYDIKTFPFEMTSKTQQCMTPVITDQKLLIRNT